MSFTSCIISLSVKFFPELALSFTVSNTIHVINEYSGPSQNPQPQLRVYSQNMDRMGLPRVCEHVLTPHRFQLSNQLAYTPNFQLTHTFRAPAKSLNILLGTREGGVCNCRGLGGFNWWMRQKQAGSKQWRISWQCEPPQGALCQIINVSQTSGKWGSMTFHSRGKEMKDIHRGERNSNMGFLLLAVCHFWVEITCSKRSCGERSLP